MKSQRHEELRKTIFKLLYYNGALSLAELSSRTKKSIPNVTSVVNGLIRDGYVTGQELAPSTGGRRAVKYRLNKKKDRYIVVVAMDQFVTRIVLYNLRNEAVHPETAITLPLQDNESALDHLCSFIDDYINESAINRQDILGVGIGMPGFVDVERGINTSYMNDSDETESLRDKLTKRLALRVSIENDSSAIAISELHFGAAKGMKDVMVVNVGWGIGLGMIVNGSLFRGHNGFAGEFSHIPLSDSNKLCVCGKRGCLEVVASLLVAVNNARQDIAAGEISNLSKLFKDKTKAEGDHLIAAARKGDQLAIRVLTDAAFMMGKGIATLIHIMNPERVVLSGRGGAAGGLLLPPVYRAIHEFCIPKLVENTDVVVSSLTYRAELLGAASLVIENCILDEKTTNEHKIMTETMDYS